ncbi:molybdopterin-binding protein [Mangrovactinospora gilvigrisea]|uniref:Molybdopterin-binding protein n=1 Tax=Mangrovactinospora gilvigrisea TaxID=1428644 RepID=A0A1J7BFX5_9ACTN|nr:molybdopterin-dependent oxidoreductase [Mangrovactinospora gilvigrisea]OIV37477.1 molybdopterin-binding protein [Mangrovactinospora gilvigrisea]
MKGFTSTLRTPRLTSQLGVWLGPMFAICFVTGFISHEIQHPASWFFWPAHPVWLYRVTQGMHVATGLASIPLVLAKLWSVFPRLLRLPGVRRWANVQTWAQLLERLSVLVLVVAAIVQLSSGVLNIARWYAAMGFFFTSLHYWTAWVVTGSLLVHIGVKLPVVRRALAAPVRPLRRPPAGLTRRGLLTTVAATSAVVTAATVGETVRPLAAVSVLADRDPRVGPQGVPVNKSALAAGVHAAATSPDWRLAVSGPARTVRLSLSDLAAMRQTTAALPITCVEGWSAGATWTGVALRDLVHLVGGDGADQVAAISLQRGSAYARSIVDPPHARDPETLIALRLHGEPLHLDHGYPARLIAPNRPGVLQTKWLSQLIVGSAA